MKKVSRKKDKKSLSPKKTIQDFPHYWICMTCATAKGGTWPEGHVATVSIKPCEYCNDAHRQPNEAIAPWVDFDWPDAKLTRTARMNRD